MATKNFTQFSTAAPLTTGDYIVGYKEDGSQELKTTVKQILDLVQDSNNQTLLFDENSKNLSITSGNTVSLSSFTANADLDSYKTNVASATATLLPTSIYQSASGNWQDAFTTVQNNSASWEESADITAITTTVASNSSNWNQAYNVATTYQQASGFWQAASTLTSLASADTILNGGNTRGSDVTIGTNDGFDLRLETNNSVRVNILSSGDVGIGTGGNDSNVTERLTVQGNINLRGIPGTETRFIEIGTGRTGNGNSYIDLIGDATHSDFGTRILREDTGPNANSYVRHKGTGNLIFEAIDAGSLKFFTDSQERGTIDSVGNFSFGNVVPNERLTVLGNISAIGVVYAQGGNSTQWNLASSTAINYTHTNFLPLTGGIISGETRINNNLTVFGNLTATGTTTFANTVFSTTSALSVVHVGSGPAMWVGNDGDGDIASFYDIDSNVEVLHVGGNTGSFPNVGVKTSTPNKDLTVNGEISASNTIYDNVGNSTQWNQAYSIGTAYQSASGNWQNTFTTVQANSASWEESADIIPTVTNYLSTNNVLVSSLQVNGFAGFDGSRSITIGPNTFTYSMTSKEAIVANKNLFIIDTVNFPSSPIRTVFTDGGNFRTVVDPTMIFGTNSDQHLRFRAGGPTSNEIRMTILSSGDVGIGTTLSETVAAGNGGLRIKNNLLVGGTTTATGTISSQSTIFSSNRQVVTTNTTTVPGTSAVTSILAVSALPVVQETGVLYIVI